MVGVRGRPLLHMSWGGGGREGHGPGLNLNEHGPLFCTHQWPSCRPTLFYIQNTPCPAFFLFLHIICRPTRNPGRVRARVPPTWERDSQHNATPSPLTRIMLIAIPLPAQTDAHTVRPTLQPAAHTTMRPAQLVYVTFLQCLPCRPNVTGGAPIESSACGRSGDRALER